MVAGTLGPAAMPLQLIARTLIGLQMSVALTEALMAVG
jgi:hypothetical protein